MRKNQAVPYRLDVEFGQGTQSYVGLARVHYRAVMSMVSAVGQ